MLVSLAARSFGSACWVLPGVVKEVLSVFNHGLRLGCPGGGSLARSNRAFFLQCFYVVRSTRGGAYNLRGAAHQKEVKQG